MKRNNGVFWRSPIRRFWFYVMSMWIVVIVFLFVSQR